MVMMTVRDVRVPGEKKKMTTAKHYFYGTTLLLNANIYLGSSRE
jgi:hypothetical protein